MELDELLKKLLEAEVAKAAPKAEEAKPKAEEAPKAEAAAPALDMDALSKLIGEAVAKALPAPARAEGAGSRAESGAGTTEAVKAEDKPKLAMAELVKKAATTDPEKLTPAEKRAIWSVTYAALRKGLADDPREQE